MVRKALVVLEELGTEVMEVSLPHIEYASYVSNVISWSEAAAVHEEWLRTRPQEYSDQVRERLMSGALFPATLYHQAQRVRAVIRREMEEALEQVDVMVTPTCPVSAPRIGQDYVDIRGRKEPTLGTLANLTRPFNLAGLPVISVSCGFGASGLPAGMSIAGPHFTEGLVMQVAHAYEEATGWHKQHPNL